MKQFILLLGVVMFLLSAGFVALAESADERNHIEVVVQPGETLWQIANEHYDDSRDIRVVIHDIKIQNNLNNSIIQPGETLQLPQY